MATPVLSSLVRLAAELLAPTCCAACGDETGGAPFCGACDAERGEPVVDRVGGLPLVAAGPYAGPIARAVRRLKYADHPEVAGPLGVLVADALRRAGPEGSALLVPVPLHPARLAERGYNQSALVARSAARELDFPWEPRALARLRATGKQATLERAEREHNVAGAFASRPAMARWSVAWRSLSGRRVAIVDDVVTTGATALACAEALTRAGAEVAFVAAVARTKDAPREAIK